MFCVESPAPGTLRSKKPPQNRLVLRRPLLSHRPAAGSELCGIEFVQPRSQRARVFLIHHMAGLGDQL